MARHLTEVRRDAVILDLLGKALHALNEDIGGSGRREARLWIDRAAAIIRNLAVPSSSPGEQARRDAVEAVLARIVAHLERDEQRRAGSRAAGESPPALPHHNS